MATMLRRPEDHSVAIAEQAATRELVRPEQKTTMRLPRKHIAEGIAVAIMVGVGGERGALLGRAKAEGVVTFTFCEDGSVSGTRIRVRERDQSVELDDGLTLTSLHGRCWEVEP